MKTSERAVPSVHRIRLRNVFLRRTNWNGADLTEANLEGTDLTNATLAGVDLARANLSGTILRGADLTGARNLTSRQLAEAVIDDTTRLPSYIDRTEITGRVPDRD